MLGTLLITLREGVEASLIVGIILAYLKKTGNRRGSRPVWAGTATAVVASIAVGAAVFFTAGQLTGPAEQLFEGSTTLLAAGILTWMVFWMRSRAYHMRAELQAKADAVGANSSVGLFLLAFTTVVREGIETALFLFAGSGATGNAVLPVAGGLLGLGAAALLGYAAYRGASWLNLRTFFAITGFFLILFAAGLLIHSLHEFEEAGIIPALVEHVWDTGAALPEESVIGAVLASLFGYTASPSLVQIVAYGAYLAASLAAYFAPRFRRAALLRPRSSG
jgi:high-affinity iron transporter